VVDLVVACDGASRGNPGPAAVGVAFSDSTGTEVRALSRRIGFATNNQAEFLALIAGLEEAQRLGARRIEVRLDSELVVRQVVGRYRVRHPGLRPLFEQARQLLCSFEEASVRQVPRERNRRADALANAALDGP
jgi:ribonuclease HI